jgi:hypothetical protein
MPRLGEPVEPVRAERVDPWWRAVDAAEREPQRDTPALEAMPTTMPWPID